MHSILFVPAVEKMINKISTFFSDGYIIDLEDSILPKDKNVALSQTINFLENSKELENLFIRVDREFLNEQITELNKYSFAGYMIPKYEEVENFHEIYPMMKQKKIIALVETPKGVANIENIAKCYWIDAVAFGAEDYTAYSNMKNSPNVLNYVKSRMVMYCKAYGKKIYDTPCFELDDMQLFREIVQESRDMGFDGKLAINPKQIQIINDVFKNYDYDYMKNIVEEYEINKMAVQTIDNKVYEKMHIERLKKILKENGYY